MSDDERLIRKPSMQTDVNLTSGQHCYSLSAFYVRRHSTGLTCIRTLKKGTSSKVNAHMNRKQKRRITQLVSKAHQHF